MSRAYMVQISLQNSGGKVKVPWSLNPCSPEGFSQTYFPKGGVVATPPLDYQY